MQWHKTTGNYYFSQFCGLAEWFFYFHLDSLMWLYRAEWGRQCVSKMASCTALMGGTGCHLGCFVLLHAASHPSWLDWVPYVAFSEQCFKREEAFLEAGLWNSHNSTSATFDWWKQVTRPVQIQSGETDSTLWWGFLQNIVAIFFFFY